MSKFELKLDSDSLNFSLGRCECDGPTAHKVSQRRLTADLLAPRESDCSRMLSKVSDWLPGYIKATRPGSQDIQNGWILSGQTSYGWSTYAFLMIIIHVKLRFKMFDFRDISERLIHKKKEVKLSLSMHVNEYTGSCITVPLLFNFGITLIYCLL